METIQAGKYDVPSQWESLLHLSEASARASFSLWNSGWETAQRLQALLNWTSSWRTADPIYLMEQEDTQNRYLLVFTNILKEEISGLCSVDDIKSHILSALCGALREHFFWPLDLCLKDLRPNWAAHGSGMWVTENSTAENKTCCCNDGGGNARTYWQEEMIQSPGLFFFLPSPFKQTPDGHPAGMTISLLRFWQPLIPCSFPSLYKK